jgi:DME family drug/metabolite transporter
VFLILSPDSSSTFAAAGVAAALVSGLGYAAYATAAKHQMEGGLDPAASMASLFGIGAALTAPLLLLEPVAWLRTGGGALMIVHLGVVTIGGAYTLYGRGLRLLPTPTVVTLTLAEPVTAAVLSVAVLGESLGITGWCGVAVVVTGLFVATRTGTVTAPAAERPATRRTTA